MKVLIDIGHPAHVHMFKHFAWQLITDGHQVLFSVRKKNITVNLLQSYGFDFIVYGKSRKGIVNKLVGLLKFNLHLYKITKKFKPDISISHSSFYLSQVCWLLGIPNITLEDTGNAEQVNLYRYLTDAILTSSVFHKHYGKKQISYNGYHELAYLYPKYFRPNDHVLSELGLNNGEKFVLLRFISWEASHDIGQAGISLDNKIKLIKLLKENYKVFISAEDTLPQELVRYQLNISPEKMHDILYYADIYIGEGATMASESALIGTPAVYVNSLEAGTINDQEKYGLLFHFRSEDGFFDKVRELLQNPHLKENLAENKKTMLNDKIDVTAFLVWFVENWPTSMKIMKETPEYQERFR